MKNHVFGKVIVLMLILVLFVMTLPTSAADSDDAKSLIVLQDSGNEISESESLDEENNETRIGEAYIFVSGSSWTVAAGFGYFVGSITYWDSSSGIAFGETEPAGPAISGTLNWSGHDRATFIGWVRNDYNSEYYIYFTV